MPDVIDLISSDPPSPEKLQPQPARQAPRPVSSRPAPHLDQVSSDSIDVSVFANDDFLYDNPTKKRRVSHEKRSPLRKATSACETKPPDPGPSFLFSDEDFGLPPPRPTELNKQSGRDAEDSDPIVFTSSAPEPSTRPKPPVLRKPPREGSDIITLDDDDDFLKSPGKPSGTRFTQESIEEFSDPFSMPGFTNVVGLSQPEPASKTVFSSKTAQLLASLNSNSKGAGSGNKSKIPSRSRKPQGAGMDAATLSELSDEVDEPAEPRRPAKKSSKMTTAEKEAKAKARAETKEKRDQERQLEKERKQQLKEEKAKQKQLAADIADVNKLKVDKKDSTPEMIVDMSSSLEEGSVGNQTIEFMKRLGVEHNFVTSRIPNVVTWRRKMNATYNEAAGHWEPCPFYIQEEKHVLCLVPAQDFVDLVIPAPDGEERDTLELHVSKTKSAYPDCKVIYLIESLTAWMRKNRNSRNRAYQAEVLRQYEPPATEEQTTSRGRGRKPKNKPETTPPVDDDTIEDALLTLQVAHQCLIHHTNAPAESAEWIKNFTEHISTIPYRRERMEGNDSAFCMDGGQVKTGDDKLDTFVKMLQEVNRVTASMAYGITSQYPTVTDLTRGMRMHGPSMLEDVRVSLLFNDPIHLSEMADIDTLLEICKQNWCFD